MLEFNYVNAQSERTNAHTFSFVARKKNYFKGIFRNILIIVFLLLRARITFYNTEPTKCIKSIQFAECFFPLFLSLFYLQQFNFNIQ